MSDQNTSTCTCEPCLMHGMHGKGDKLDLPTESYDKVIHVN